VAHRRPGLSERPGGGFFLHGRRLRTNLSNCRAKHSLSVVSNMREILFMAVVLAITQPGVAYDGTSLETNFAASLITQAENADTKQPAAAFGTRDTWRWMLQGGVGVDVKTSDNIFGQIGGGVSYFMIDNLSLELELNGMYFHQVDDDAVGLNLVLLFRWHFIAEEKWSLYFDIGAGLLGTTAKVPGPTPEDPGGGSSFNFTPQSGFGFTVEVAENMRFFAGARVFHISNAQLYDSNPGRDNLLFYAGVSLPF
jgi:hypothetical protein